MRILVISQYFWPENFRINDLVAGLAERGNDVTVLTGQPNYPSGKFFQGYGFFRKSRQRMYGADIFRAPLIPRSKGKSFQLALNFISFAIFSSLLVPFLRHKKPDVIFVFGPSPITVALPAQVYRFLFRTPVLLWVQDLWPESLSATGAIQNWFVLDLVRKLVGFIYRGCDRILVTSKAYIPSIVSNGGTPADIRYFPQSAEDLYRPLTSVESFVEDGVLPEGFRVLFAGNIGAAQSFPTILDAAEKLKKVTKIKFIILGDGRMREWLTDEIEKRELQDTVHWLGQHPLEAMPHFFAKADALLVTLKKDAIFSLTVPGKLQSYLACGKPVIAALDGEGGRIIEEAKAGFVCASEDVNGLVKAIEKLYRLDDVKRKDMGAAGLEYAKKNFDRVVLLSQLEEWMRETIADTYPNSPEVNV